MPETSTINLSKNTEVKVTSNAHKDGVTLQSLTINRNKTYGPNSTLLLDKEDCKSLTENLANITQAILTVKEEEEGATSVISLINDRVVEVSKYNGQVYCGFFTRGKNNHSIQTKIMVMLRLPTGLPRRLLIMNR